MIRTAGVKIWERENRLGPPGDQKIPLVDPSWNPNQEEGRQNMRDYRSLMMRGIKESIPRGSNTKLVFDSTQEKDKTPAIWLNQLKRNFQLYSNIDPDSPEGQVLLKVQFVTKSWPDLRRKLEKMDDWQEKNMNELLKEALRVYLRREEEKAKTKARIMITHAWFTVVDLKDAFWACPLAEECRDWFAFEWEDPDRRRKQQLRWTRLPQVFTEFPNLFGQALEELLGQFTPEEKVQILQY
ncbi:Gag polyprotein [Lonchura striata]|uniref:ribonuclease H n=1 Tax=Lonchura striata TaxID=40157 RepID=A0A218UFI4_9PASE|nr:Gag polyprotein [Lonchura striata domestica]